MPDSPVLQRSPASRKRRETVKRLIAAADEVISEKGFQRASLEEIAARASMTKGAIYSNFESKEHLFWAVVGSRRLSVPSEWRSSLSIRENLRINAEAFCANLKQSRGNAGFLAEFILYALANDEARARWAKWYGAAFEAPPAVAEEYLRAQNMPPFRVFWTAVQTLAFGFFIQHALVPELVTDELIIATMESLAPPESAPTTDTAKV
jgi:AcrR family transcriptional regulator